MSASVRQQRRVTAVWVGDNGPELSDDGVMSNSSNAVDGNSGNG